MNELKTCHDGFQSPNFFRVTKVELALDLNGKRYYSHNRVHCSTLSINRPKRT